MCYWPYLSAENPGPVVVGQFGQLVDVDAPFEVELMPEGHQTTERGGRRATISGRKTHTPITKLLSFLMASQCPIHTLWFQKRVTTTYKENDTAVMWYSMLVH